MIPEKLSEFNVLLQLENLAKDNENFAEYLQKFDLLDEFLNPYMRD